MKDRIRQIIIEYLMGKEGVAMKSIKSELENKGFKLDPVDIRKHIQNIRESMGDYIGSYYIVASNKGYRLTDCEFEIQDYLVGLKKRFDSLKMQISEGEMIINEQCNCL